MTYAITTNESGVYELTRWIKNGLVDHTDFWINPEETILEGIYDVPDDHGLAVRIDTWRSAYDNPLVETPVTHYEVYRLQAGKTATDMSDKLDGWDLVSTVPADGADHKQFVVPTLCDSSSVDLCLTTFMVRACTADPLTFFDSDLISGYSVDNDTGTDVEPEPPAVFALHANVPNPFNPQTVLRYDLPRASQVSLAVYDVSGARVRVLRDGDLEPAGRREAVWNGCDDAGLRVASGVYFCKIEAEGFRATQRMMLVK